MKFLLYNFLYFLSLWQALPCSNQVSVLYGTYDEVVWVHSGLQILQLETV
jgi:hypothetical protein